MYVITYVLQIIEALVHNASEIRGYIVQSFTNISGTRMLNR